MKPWMWALNRPVSLGGITYHQIPCSCHHGHVGACNGLICTGCCRRCGGDGQVWSRKATRYSDLIGFLARSTREVP